jgi:hypothetical protein
MVFFLDITPFISLKSEPTFRRNMPPLSSMTNMHDSFCYLLYAALLLGSFSDAEDGGEISVEFQRTTEFYIPQDRTFPVAAMRRAVTPREDRHRSRAA